jgi:hypothetical protein
MSHCTAKIKILNVFYLTWAESFLAFMLISIGQSVDAGALKRATEANLALMTRHPAGREPRLGL